ncbi:zinc finger CCHC domain-containing protein 12-like [Silurus meridionalis]|uniref:zinc finger CCHC domain-containing protein 12-like n=1 Tax=Silurus meridionalis TaxID=175797 RepID=UPI001EEB3ABE|nr:zinc finger CCHC domain-containing protein 12-like [Silurus meridionalis]
MESDYDTWRSNVEFHLTDANLSARHIVRKIVESLSPPATNVVKHLGLNATPRDYISLLDSAYGVVDDGDELFAKFLNTNQNTGEKPSSYLQRLQLVLNKVISRGGIVASDLERQLIKQFCRGCWDNSLITNLQLEQKKHNPPSFSEFLLLLRTEEDRQAAKSSRMKQHLGLSKTKAQACSLTTKDYVTNDMDNAIAADATSSASTHNLEKQLTQLQAQVASLKASLSGNSNQTATKKTRPKAKVSTEENTLCSGDLKLTKKPRPGYCFKCGEDGHIASSCSNEPNYDLVEVKRNQFKQKQKAWENQNKLDLN